MAHQTSDQNCLTCTADDNTLGSIRQIDVIKPNRFCYYVQKDHGFRENIVSVIVSTFLIFTFVDELLPVDLCSPLY